LPVLVDQNAPPAALIPSATRSFPVGAISLRKSSLRAGPANITTPSSGQTIDHDDRTDIQFPSSRGHILAQLSSAVTRGAISLSSQPL
jgi:hypothetical protein